MYQTIKNKMTGNADCVKRLTDGACIPFDPANTDFLEYQKWLALGNQPLPPDEAA